MTVNPTSDARWVTVHARYEDKSVVEMAKGAVTDYRAILLTEGFELNYTYPEGREEWKGEADSFDTSLILI